MPVPRQIRVLLWLAPLIALNWLAIAFLRIDDGWAGLVFGCLYAQTTLAAVWMTFGRFRFAYRAALVLLWIGLLVVAILINNDRSNGRLLFISYLLVHFTTAAMLLGAVRAVRGHSLRHGDDPPVPVAGRLQFGVGQMLFFMTFLAAVLSFGRHAGPIVAEPAQIDSWFRYSLFAALCGLVTPPLMLMLLAQRRPILKTTLYLLVLALIIPLECLFHDTFATDTQEMLFLNGVMIPLTVVYAGVMRVNGYSLGSTE